MADVAKLEEAPQAELSKRPTERVREALSTIPEPVREHCRHFVMSELGEFLVWLNEVEHRLTVVPSEARTAALRAEVDERCLGIVNRGETVVEGIQNQAAKKAVKAAFRHAIAPWTPNNPFINRSLEKPRGYPGDYRMMEGAYINEHELSGGLSGVLDRFLLDHYDCVRQRKNKLKESIRAHVARLAPGGGPIRMLTLGAGSCREWFELEQELEPAERKRFANIHLTCLDQDQEALDFSRERLQGNGLLRSVDCISTNLLGFTRSEKWMHEAGTFDYVYGLGIANYFYEEMLSSIIASAFSLLKEGGELTITHKDHDAFNFPLADWVCDWVFVRRTEAAFASVFREAVAMMRMPFEFRVEREATGEIMFGIVTRLR